ncbi:MAG: CubicO group peptidase (beta-lactamase class C family) [Candidatus Poriferisodalaceae bacterium]|jgi:CubicO group peptidase (beta-lactamase class C family)
MDVFGLIDDWKAANVAVGVVSTRSGEPVVTLHGPTDRPFELASVTKPLSALAVLVAAEEGIVSLDEPLGPPGTTVRHLLAHAGGLAPDQRRLLTEPGTRRIYSNAGYEMLGDLVAERSEMTFAEYFHEAVVRPLGLTRTVLEGSPAHGGHSTVVDLLIIATELLSAAPVLIARETRVQATSAVFPELSGVLPGFGTQDPNPWGLGFEIRGRKSPHWTGSQNAPNTYGHFGRAGTFIWIDPAAGVGCVALTDREFGPWAAREWPVFSDAVLRQAT